MQYDDDLPIEDYIYNEPLKERHYDIERFKELIELNDSSNEEAATELLYVSKRLFYNQHGLEKVMEARNSMLRFWDVDTDDDTIPSTMNSGIPEHDELIDEVLNAMDDMEDLQKLNIKKLANRYPELSFLALIKIIVLELQETAPAKIMKQLDEALSIYPDDLLLKLEKEAQVNKLNKEGAFITDALVNNQKASELFKRSNIHSFELMTLHTALYEYFVNKKNVLQLDALMFASQTLYPEWEDAWSDKLLYSEILKVQFCQLLVTSS
ncbi:hypothetical protein [Carboxylicivirga taeanensis]|uniref:hypothetical protein n=1 Tax=Carboxylicivirga taeanensis TaxID=1416875 RepID=UPI003F6E436D